MLFLSFRILLMTVSAQISTYFLLQEHAGKNVSLILCQIVKTVMPDGNPRQFSISKIISDLVRRCGPRVRHLSVLLTPVSDDRCI